MLSSPLLPLTSSIAFVRDAVGTDDYVTLSHYLFDFLERSRYRPRIQD
jgi:hypothetical protein